jgi:hypothetical protein
MKFITTIAAAIMATSAFAHDYKIVRFEASDYRSFTLEELTAKIGDNASLLPMLKCNGKDEFDPFSPAHRINPLRNSLKIKAAKSDERLTYQLGHYFNSNGEEVTSFSDPFFILVSNALARFEKLEPTEKLLRQLEESYFPLTIALGNNSFNPQIEGGKFWSGMKMAQAISYFTTLRMSDGGYPFTDIGVGGQILWNPKLDIETIESDGVKRKLDKDVALAHEMYHAFDSIRGTLDMGNVQGEGYEFESVVEYRAVYFENLVRGELGIKYRKHYSDPYQPVNPPDMLDDSGAPIFIEAPCL